MSVRTGKIEAVVTMFQRKSREESESVVRKTVSMSSCPHNREKRETPSVAISINSKEPDHSLSLPACDLI